MTFLDGVRGEGTRMDNFVISWNPMPPIKHNGPGFHYRVFYRRASESTMTPVTILKWQTDHYEIPDVTTYVPFRFTVVAVNSLGESETAFSRWYRGHSGEGTPIDAPENFELVRIIDHKTAEFRWKPVDPLTIKGLFKGYKIQIWKAAGPETAPPNEIFVPPNETSTIITNLSSGRINYARVCAMNSLNSGPYSDTIEFKAPEWKPGKVLDFRINVMGSTAFSLEWEKPLESNGKIRGFNIYYEEELSDKTRFSMIYERVPQIHDPYATHAKLGGLKPNTTYRLKIAARTGAGEGERYLMQQIMRFFSL